MDLNFNMLAQQAYQVKQKAEAEIRPMLITAAQGLVKFQLFCSFLMCKFRKISPKELALFVASVFGFGLFAGLKTPRRCRKLKFVILLASIAGAAAFVYRLLTKDEA